MVKQTPLSSSFVSLDNKIFFIARVVIVYFVILARNTRKQRIQAHRSVKKNPIFICRRNRVFEVDNGAILSLIRRVVKILNSQSSHACLSNTTKYQ